eukprot:TRINITY_DN858_c0_g1_i10.p1 TRINITY_DN858_c0_g1~~TRINITY_DN858_c0_g1_i10.p1  ORF type:complete len:111 (+),score=13.27 TRINITY_DN858_c0_g1_i10:37-333(+)
MIRRPPRSTHCISSAASDVYKRQSPHTFTGASKSSTIDCVINSFFAASMRGKISFSAKSTRFPGFLLRWGVKVPYYCEKTCDQVVEVEFLFFHYIYWD